MCEELTKKNLKIDGFFTEEVREGRERIGFDIVTLDGRREVLARTRLICFLVLVMLYFIMLGAFCFKRLIISTAV